MRTGTRKPPSVNPSVTRIAQRNKVVQRVVGFGVRCPAPVDVVNVEIRSGAALLARSPVSLEGFGPIRRIAEPLGFCDRVVDLLAVGAAMLRATPIGEGPLAVVANKRRAFGQLAHYVATVVAHSLGRSLLASGRVAVFAVLLRPTRWKQDQTVTYPARMGQFSGEGLADRFFAMLNPAGLTVLLPGPCRLSGFAAPLANDVAVVGSSGFLSDPCAFCLGSRLESVGTGKSLEGRTAEARSSRDVLVGQKAVVIEEAEPLRSQPGFGRGVSLSSPLIDAFVHTTILNGGCDNNG